MDLRYQLGKQYVGVRGDRIPRLRRVAATNGDCCARMDQLRYFRHAKTIIFYCNYRIVVVSDSNGTLPIAHDV